MWAKILDSQMKWDIKNHNFFCEIIERSKSTLFFAFWEENESLMSKFRSIKNKKNRAKSENLLMKNSRRL